MSSKAQLYILIFILTILGIGRIVYKHRILGFPLVPGVQKEVWILEAKIEFDAKDQPVKVSFTLPAYTSGYEIVDESFASPGYGFFNQEIDGIPRAVWSARSKQGTQRLYYQISLMKKGKPQLIGAEPYDTSVLPPTFLEEPFLTAANTVVEAAKARSADEETFTREIIRRVYDKEPSQNVRLLLGNAFRNVDRTQLIYDLVTRGNVPVRLIKGLHLEDGKRSSSIVPYLGIFDGNYWQLFNPETGEMGYPEDFIVWGRSEILDVEGGENSSVTLSMIKTDQSARALALRGVEDGQNSRLALSIYSLPVNIQTTFKMLFLIPMGALVVVLVRNIVGMPTSGTFMPILIAMAFIETRLVPGLIVFVMMIALGLLIRLYLSHLNLLLVPRIAAIVIVVVVLMVFISVIGNRLGLEYSMSVTLFPMIIISWTIERMSILWEEQGAKEVFRQGGGSLVTAVLAFFMMTNEYIQFLTFMFPETLFILLAIILAIGTYTGYRLTELWRFESLAKE